MKTPLRIVSLALFFTFVFLCGNVYSQSACKDKVADNLINKAIQIKPGEQVVIIGNNKLVNLMEQLALRIDNAGGHSSMFVYSDTVTYNYWHHVPVAYIQNDRGIMLDYLLSADIVINLPTCTDCKAVYANIPQDRRPLMQSKAEDVAKMNQSKLREYYVSYPAKEMAQIYGFNPDKYEEMVLNALGTDYNLLSARCYKVNELLKNGKQIKVTCPNGTHFTATLNGSKPVLNEGTISEEKKNSNLRGERQVSLPGGTVTIVPDENSGEGIIVSRYDADMNTQPLRNVKGEIHEGMIENMDAETGNEFISDYFQTLEGNERQLSSIYLGVNPDLKIGTEPALSFWQAEGMVMIGFGGNNTGMGGNINTQNSWYFPVYDATVEVDGKEIIKDGKFLL